MDPELEADPDEVRDAPTTRAKETPVDDVDKKGRTIVCVINDDQVDEYGTVILPKGIDLKPYARNGVFLWCHQAGLPPLGRAVWTALRDGKSKIKAKIRFDEDEFSEIIFSKYESGSMNAVSIRFDPDYEHATAPTADELKERPDWKKAWVVYRKSVLKEISAVTLGGNVNCLVEEVSRGLVPYLPDDVRDAIERIGKKAPAPAKAPETTLPRLDGAVSFDQMQRAIAERVARLRPEELVRAAHKRAIDAHRGVI